MRLHTVVLGRLVAGVFFPCLAYTMDSGALVAAIDKGHFKVLTVARDYLKDDMASLSNEGMVAVLSGIDERLEEKPDPSVPVFVVFSGYACSRQTQGYDQFKGLLNCVIEHSKGPKWLPCFCYINFLYKLQNAPSPEDVKWLRGYLTNSLDDFMINDANLLRHPWLNIGISDRKGMIDALKEGPAGYFANETFVIHRGRVISRYRKATYNGEDPVLARSKWVYFFGRGYEEPTEDGGALALELVKRVGTDICRDIALSFKLWLHRLLLAKRDDKVKKRFFADYAEAKKFITKDFDTVDYFSKQKEVVDPFEFKVRIIQSNTVGLSEYIDNFSDGQIVIQSDPQVSGVVKIQWPRHTHEAVDRYKLENSGADSGWVIRMNTPFICHSVPASGGPWQIKVESSDFLARSFTCIFYEVKERS